MLQMCGVRTCIPETPMSAVAVTVLLAAGDCVLLKAVLEAPEVAAAVNSVQQQWCSRAGCC